MKTNQFGRLGLMLIWLSVAQAQNTDSAKQLHTSERHAAHTNSAGTNSPPTLPDFGSESQDLLKTTVAADKGDANAQFKLGVYYFEGKNVAKNSKEAAFWWKKAAQQDHPAAQFKLAGLYLVGDGVTQDSKEADRLTRLAASGNLKAEEIFGETKAGSMIFFATGMLYVEGKGLPQNEAEATRWFRMSAENGFALAQLFLAQRLQDGIGVMRDEQEAATWYRRAANQDFDEAQFKLGVCYFDGQGVPKDEVEAVKWYRKAANQNLAKAQFILGLSYADGQGVIKNETEAVKWYRKAAEQNNAAAQFALGNSYAYGLGVPKDYVEAYKWILLAAAQGIERAKEFVSVQEGVMTQEQIAEGQKLAREFKPRKALKSGSSKTPKDISDSNPSASGTGFFISEDGFLITNEHVVHDATQVRLLTRAGIISAKVVKVDAANDFALLKAEGKFSALPVVASRAARLGNTVATVGFPNIGLQGFAPKFARGEIAALSGAQDDARFFQISVPVQPGNSGGALVDERGNVVGVVAAKLSAKAALTSSGALPENVNYAVKSSFLLSFLESVPEVSATLKEANAKERKFDDVVKAAEEAAVLVLVY